MCAFAFARERVGENRNVFGSLCGERNTMAVCVCVCACTGPRVCELVNVRVKERKKENTKSQRNEIREGKKRDKGCLGNEERMAE